MIMMTVCAGVAFVTVVFTVKSYSLTREDDAQLKQAGKAWVSQQAEARRGSKRNDSSA